jgi:hypothetical protein
MTFSVEVENKFEMAQRDIHVLRKVWGDTKESHRVRYPDGNEKRAVDLSLGTVPEEADDYLEISVDKEKRELGPCRIDLPADIPFSFIPSGARSITVVPAVGSGQTSLRIPAGLPGWRLQLMKPQEPLAQVMEEADSGNSNNNVTVGDDGPGGDG